MDMTLLLLLGVEVKFKDVFYQTLIYCAGIPELSLFDLIEEGLLVGGAITLTALANYLAQLLITLPGNY